MALAQPPDSSQHSGQHSSAAALACSHTLAHARTHMLPRVRVSVSSQWVGWLASGLACWRARLLAHRLTARLAGCLACCRPV